MKSLQKSGQYVKPTQQNSHDLDAIYEDIKRSEAEHLAPGGKFVDPPAPTPGITHSDYQKIRFGELSEQT